MFIIAYAYKTKHISKLFNLKKTETFKHYTNSSTHILTEHVVLFIYIKTIDTIFFFITNNNNQNILD